jgi:Tol biopolymer transport system component
MYKEGQNFLLHLSEKYGIERIVDLLDNWYRSDNFEATFRMTFGVSLREADEEWFSAVRRHYYPAVAVAQSVTEVARRLTPHGYYNLGPRVLPAVAPGDTALRFCYFAATEGSVDLMISEPGQHGKRREERVLRGGVSPQFESFHLFQNRPDASPSGLIALSSKRGGRDAMYLVDARRRKVVRQLEFDNLVAINDPSLAPGDTAVVFSAQDIGGRSDLYRVWWRGQDVRLERLTNDDFDDLEPDVSPDGKWIVFASDRGDRAGKYSLFRMPFMGGTPEAVSDPPAGDDRQPVYSPDGKWIAYRSSRGGTFDLYVRSAEPSLEARRVTHLLGPALDPDWMSNGKGLVFNGQHAIQFQAYQITFDPDTLKPETEIPEPRRAVLPTAVMTDAPKPYQRRLGLDLVSNAVSLDPGLSSGGGGGQVALSDVLGNEQLYIFLSNDSERFGSFWDGFEVGLTYLNRAQRLNWGVGLFRLTQLYDADLNVIRREKRLGMMGLASYPFSKFSRIEGSVLIRNAQDHLLRSGASEDVNLVSNYLAFIRDNSRWTHLGPSGGSRMYLSTGFTRDLSGGQGDYATMQAELREYVAPIPQVVLAARAQGQASTWRDAQQFYLGGWSSIRGFDRRELSGVQTALVQTEMRFPLIRGLTFAVPAPWRFPAISGALFADAAWTWKRNGTSSGLQLDRRWDQRAGSVGGGFYVLGGYYPALRWDYVWTTEDFRTFTRKPRTQFSLGWNF